MSECWHEILSNFPGRQKTFRSENQNFFWCSPIATWWSVGHSQNFPSDSIFTFSLIHPTKIGKKALNFFQKMLKMSKERFYSGFWGCNSEFSTSCGFHGNRYSASNTQKRFSKGEPTRNFDFSAKKSFKAAQKIFFFVILKTRKKILQIFYLLVTFGNFFLQIFTFQIVLHSNSVIYQLNLKGINAKNWFKDQKIL